MTRSTCLAVIVILSLAGCVKEVAAPANLGVCWHAIPLKGGQYRFNKVSEHEASIETCAGALEGMRERFLALGGQTHDIIGAYQGSYLFLGPDGVYIAQSEKGQKYLALVLTGDGRLAAPGSMPSSQ